MARYLAKAAEIPGVKIGTSAMEACGMQPEFAAHMMQQNQSLGVSLILRAGSPPVYNQKRGPKTGFNLTKTSNHGLFRGSLAAQREFTRIDSKTRQPAGHNAKDAAHLIKPIKDPDYQHTVALPVTMQDILRELGPNGDLYVLGYDENTQLLRLAYHPGKGPQNFNGQFIVNLGEGDNSPIFYSRPWDKPSHQLNWDPKKEVITKPESLNAVPDAVYERVFNQTFVLAYTDTQRAEPSIRDIKEAKVFANTPRTSADLLKAIKSSGLIVEGSRRAEFFSTEITEASSREEMLAQFSDEEIQSLYDRIGLVTTGDWDGLAIGISKKLLEGFPEETMRVYNTFSQANAIDEIYALQAASIAYFNHLKQLPVIQGTDLHNLLNKIEDPNVLFSEFALARAGCITPHEFLYQQLINYTHRDEMNSVYGNDRGRAAVQAGIDKALAFAKTDVTTNPDQKFKNALEVALKAYREAAVKGEYHAAWRKIDEEHLSNHLKIALDLPQSAYLVPNVDHDHNVHDLFQHGFDVRNPYGVSEDGPWLMITNDGGTIYGKNQEQLISALLIDDFLKDNIITVPKGYDMAAGWGAIVEKQLSIQNEGIALHLKGSELEAEALDLEEDAIELEAQDAPEAEVDALRLQADALKSKAQALKSEAKAYRQDISPETIQKYNDWRTKQVELQSSIPRRGSVKERFQSYVFGTQATDPSATADEKQDLKEGSSNKLGGGL